MTLCDLNFPQHIYFLSRDNQDIPFMVFCSSIATENNSYKLLINFYNTHPNNIHSWAIFNSETKETK